MASSWPKKTERVLGQAKNDFRREDAGFEKIELGGSSSSSPNALLVVLPIWWPFHRNHFL